MLGGEAGADGRADGAAGLAQHARALLGATAAARDADAAASVEPNHFPVAVQTTDGAKHGAPHGGGPHALQPPAGELRGASSSADGTGVAPGKAAGGKPKWLKR